MDGAVNGHEYLYTTVVPVLLGEGVPAGRVAREIHLRHEIISHWFGHRRGMGLWGCARYHRLPHPVEEMSDSLLLQILLDFASEQSGLLVLYPCSSEAASFAARKAEALESRFVILPIPQTGDPLSCIVLKND
ncbi:MAG: hypothetical protein IJW90_04480 [Clostridia bacterium]|nr:hypothetical protein [Clostridia bacterium]